MSQGTYKVVLTSDATRGQDDYIQHFGVLGMKWGVRKDKKRHISKSKRPQPKPKKTYEFEPYQTELRTAKDLLKSAATWPYKMVSESYKRHKDPEYKKKSDEFISQHKEELLMALLQSMGLVIRY